MFYYLNIIFNNTCLNSFLYATIYKYVWFLLLNLYGTTDEIATVDCVMPPAQ